MQKDKRLRLIVGDITKRSDLKGVLSRDTFGAVHLATLVGVKMCRERHGDAVSTNVYGRARISEEEYRIFSDFPVHVLNSYLTQLAYEVLPLSFTNRICKNNLPFLFPVF